MNAVVFTELLKLGMEVIVNPRTFLFRISRMAQSRCAFGVMGALMAKGC